MATNLLSTEITARLASYCVAARHAALPPSVYDFAKLLVLDDFSSMLVGSVERPGRLIGEYARAMGTSGPCTILGGESGFAAPVAALANGMAGHADEIDGTHVAEGHPGVIITAACLAAAELCSASGRQLIDAMSLAYDVGTRIVRAAGGRATMYRDVRIHSDVCYAIGAAAGVGALLGLTVDQLRYAFALAAVQVNMPAAFFDEPDHISKALNCGQAAYAGVAGAMMAAGGFTANANILGDEFGVLNAWSRAPDFGMVLGGLGAEYAILECNFKFYNVGYPIHAPVHAILRLMRRCGFTYEDIDSVEVHMTTNSATIVDNRDMPSICLQDMLGLAICLGRLDFDDPGQVDSLKAPEFKRVRAGIEIIRDSELDAVDPDGRGGWIRVQADGRSFVEEQKFPPGHSRLGAPSWDSIAYKFGRLAGRVLDDKSLPLVVDLISGLEDLPDITLVTRHLATQRWGL